MASFFLLSIFGCASLPTGLIFTVYSNFSVLLTYFSPSHIIFWEETLGEMFSLHNSSMFSLKQYLQHQQRPQSEHFWPCYGSRGWNERFSVMCSWDWPRLSNVPPVPAPVTWAESHRKWNAWCQHLLAILTHHLDRQALLGPMSPSQTPAGNSGSVMWQLSWVSPPRWLTPVTHHKFHYLRTLLSEFQVDSWVQGKDHLTYRQKLWAKLQALLYRSCLN